MSYILKRLISNKLSKYKIYKRLLFSGITLQLEGASTPLYLSILKAAENHHKSLDIV